MQFHLTIYKSYISIALAVQFIAKKQLNFKHAWITIYLFVVIMYSVYKLNYTPFLILIKFIGR